MIEWCKLPLSFIRIVSVSQVTIWSLKFMIMPNSPIRSRLIDNNHIICAWWLRTVIYMKFSRITHLFLEIELWGWKCHKPSCCSKLTADCTPGGCIIVISLMNRSGEYSSLKILHLITVSKLKFLFVRFASSVCTMICCINIMFLNPFIFQIDRSSLCVVVFWVWSGFDYLL
jgi:hypothetical protein